MHQQATQERHSRTLFINSPRFLAVYVASFAFLFWLVFGLTGFNPTDDGFVLAHSWRILNGEIPHRDFTSPRPVGFALLHVPELLLPWGTFALSRLVVLAEFAVIAWVSVRIFFRPGRISNPSAVLLFSLGFIMNVGAWPIMAWYTIDGIFITMVAVWLTQSKVKSHWIYAIVWVLAGFAPLTKQGFLITPLIIGLFILQYKKYAAFKFVWGVAIAPLGYFLWTIQTPGGLLSQLSKGSLTEYLDPAFRMFSVLTTPIGSLSIVIVLSGFTLLFVMKSASYMKKFIIAVAIILPTLLLSVRESFSISGDYAYQALIVFIIATIYVAYRSLTIRIFDFAAIALLAYGVSISWGAPAPSLLTGTLVVGVFAAALTEFAEIKFNTSQNLIILLIVATLLACATNVRLLAGYRETEGVLPDRQTSVPGFALIRMSEQSVAYLESINTCLKSYPSDKVAIFPDGPAIYPGFRILNPFDIDWPLPVERTWDFSQRMRKNIAEINAGREAALILQQGFPLYELSSLSVSDLERHKSKFFYAKGDAELFGQIDGESVRCGSLSGVRISPRDH